MTNHIGPVIAANLGYCVIDCSCCGFAHLFPLPDADTVKAYYEDDKFYETHSPPDWLTKEAWEHTQGYWEAYYDYLANFLEREKPVIDIGAGAGWFIGDLFATSCGDWQVIGVEPSLVARSHSPIHWKLVASLDEVGGKGNIVLMLTLEHILDPETFLRDTILPHLDGRLIITVPNEFNLLQRWAGGDWFVSPVHLNYFTKKSLRGLLERVGLRVVHEGATFPVEVFIAVGYDYRGNEERGRRVHQFRLRLEKRFPGIFKLYAYLFKTFGIGREIIMVAEKNETA